MNRRNFLQTLVAAPAIVSAGNIMRIKPIVAPDVNDYVVTVSQWGIVNVLAEYDSSVGDKFIIGNGIVVPNAYWVRSAKAGEVGIVRFYSAA